MRGVRLRWLVHDGAQVLSSIYGQHSDGCGGICVRVQKVFAEDRVSKMKNSAVGDEKARM